MENKYFTPDIEDIHVGYEGEVSYLHEDKFTPFKLRHAEETSDFLTGYYNRKVRTPFLTKEQIEKEGWVIQERTQWSVEGRIGFRKDNYFLVLDINKEIPQVTVAVRDPSALWKELDYKPDVVAPEYFAFTAEIKSINEFRTQMKLLKL